MLQIRTILDKPTAGEMEEALDQMPRDIGDAFEETLQRIKNQPDGQDTLGMNTLMWLAHARRPLLAAELSEALAIRLGSASLSSKFRPSQKRMVDCCMGLATVDEKSAVIRLMHHSVQEYLHMHRNRVFNTGERDIAQKCITYLLFEPFALGPRRNSKEIEELISQHIFASYAACHWGEHVLADKNAQVDLLALQLLRAEAQRGCSYQVLLYTKKDREEYWSRQEYWTEEQAQSCNGLHLAAIFGLEKLAEHLLDAEEVGVNDATSIGSTALMKAASCGHERFVRLLLSRKADPRKENRYGTTALHAAAETGQVSVILELWESGVDIDFRGRQEYAPLDLATLSGHRNAIQTLLELGANVNLVGNNEFTALHYAVLWEQPLEIVKILLENGANMECHRHGATALHYAALMGWEEKLLLLLQHGAKVHAGARLIGTPLHTAAAANHVAIIRHLLQYGADINARDRDGGTALHHAAKNGCEESVKALIENGADCEASSRDGRTPLDIATQEKHTSVAQLLRDAGAKMSLDEATTSRPVKS